MSSLETILDGQAQEILAQARKRLSCEFPDKERREQGIEYVTRRLDGRINGPKPRLRSRVAHRLLQLEHDAQLRRLDDFIGDLDNE